MALWNRLREILTFDRCACGHRLSEHAPKIPQRCNVKNGTRRCPCWAYRSERDQ